MSDVSTTESRHAMRIHALRRLIPFGLALLTLPAAALAQDIRWYQIEVLVFRNLAPQAQFEEQWPTTVGLRMPSPSYEMPSPGSGGSAQPLERYEGLSYDSAGSSAGAAPLLNYVPLPPGAGQLSGAQARLSKSGGFRVLDYRIWRQALKADARPVYLHLAAGELNGEQAELEGYIGLSLKHFLEVDADLWWIDLAGGEAGDAAEGGFTRVAHLREKRRMRSSETHYLDHPLIGLLIRITPTSGAEG